MRNLFFTKSLNFEVNVIGYPSEGECILFFIKNDDKVCYAGLVDCYLNNNADAIRKIMNRENVDKLDFVCWTHPHDDHTKGLDGIIDEFCNGSTIFWATDIIPEDYSLYSEESRNVYMKLKELHLSKKSTKLKIKYAKNATVMERLIISGLQNYVFEIRSFAPNSTVLAERKINNQEEAGNIYSIGLVINIGHFYIMLAGDVENPTFRTVEDGDIEFPLDYIKIPHHGSPSASFLVDRMMGLNMRSPSVATTTLYRKGRIPKPEILEKYRIWGTETIFATGNIEDKKMDKNAYGIITTTFDVLEQKEYPIETCIEGNSVVIGEKKMSSILENVPQ